MLMMPNNSVSKNPNDKYIYVSPMLSEVDNGGRIHTSVLGVEFISPSLEDDNKTYKKVVRLAMEKKGGSSLAAKFDSICARLEKNPDKYEHTDKAAQDMMKLWQDNCNGEDGLHNMLQGHNGWLMSQLNSGNPDVKQYINTLESKHQMKLDSPNIEGDLARDYYEEWGYVNSRIFSFNKETNLLSLQRQLNKIGLKGTKTGDREMTDDDYKKLWVGVINQMNVTRNLKYFSTKTGDREINEDKAAIALQKEQFKAYRQEIINIYVTRLNARSTRLTSDEINNFLQLPYKYWTDIGKMGIDPHAIFDKDFDDSNFEVDYERWKKGISYNITGQTN